MAKRKQNKALASLKVKNRKQNNKRNNKQNIIAISLVVVIAILLFVSSQFTGGVGQKSATVASVLENIESKLSDELKGTFKDKLVGKLTDKSKKVSDSKSDSKSEKRQEDKSDKNSKADIVNKESKEDKPQSEVKEDSHVDTKEDAQIDAQKGSYLAYAPANFELPKVSDTKYLYHNRDGRYKVNYDPQNKMPLFVAHILTRKEVSARSVDRSTSFTSDRHYSRMGIDLATNEDYSRSGYDRGHMVPSADRNDSKRENKATFNLSNIAPQRPALNRQTINRLEQQIREWALEHDSLYIVTGAILRDNDSRPIKVIGDGVAVPQYFYKVVAMRYKGEFKSIGFLLPNIDGVDSDFMSYATTVDDIEKIAKIDLYYNLPDSQESKMERVVDRRVWK